jgi:Fe-S cluster assembly protein SufD
MSVAAVQELSPVEQKLRALAPDPNLPEWFSAMRLQARDAYFSSAYPDRSSEAWHYGEAKRFKLDGLDIAHAQPGFNGKQYERICGLTGLPRRVSCLSMLGPRVTELSQNDALLKAGVTVMALRQALALRSEQLRPYWLSGLVCPDCDPIIAGHYALVDNGFFVHVPKGVQAPEPVHLIMESGEPGSVVAPHVLVVLEEQAAADVYVHFIGGSDAERSLQLGLVETHLGDGARLSLTKIQHLGLRTDAFTREAVRIGQDGRYSSISVHFGGYRVRHELDAELTAQGGEADLYAMHFLRGRQCYDFHTHQNHQAPDTRSNLLFKGAVTDRARASYQGLITVAPHAQKTDAYQANRTLLLSPEARSDSSPQLEIQANDVRCTHGSTTTNVGPAELFYLESRGLPRETARRLIVSGFMAQVADHIPLPNVRDYAYNYVMERLE